ncbi:GNAT family N-acetyltransferase [Aquimarina longa]|uniref:GNAT family N-acetyltransferase n=1 Tax=Aquimarina longa TaxID=1080221 RepID=UPI000783826E|nr:GNAT family N-acetyltransferase [Aquimarina longa]
MNHIRRATIKDVTQISYLGKKTFDQSYGNFFNDRATLVKYLDRSFSINKITNSVQNPENLYWIVNDTKTPMPIGYAKLKLKSSSEFIENQNVCKLQRIYLLQGYEARGIGSKLHECIVETAIDNGYDYMWLSTLKEKEQATNFYKNKGYVIAGEHDFTIGDETFEFWAMKTKLRSE